VSTRRSNTARDGTMFISYARADGRDHADHLYKALSKRGFNVWRDERDLNPYEDFTSQLEKAVAGSSHVVVCVTPGSKRSDSFVRREIGYALVLNKSIIPLLFADVVPQISIINLTWIYFLNLGWTRPSKNSSKDWAALSLCPLDSPNAPTRSVTTCTPSTGSWWNISMQPASLFSHCAPRARRGRSRSLGLALCGSRAPKILLQVCAAN